VDAGITLQDLLWDTRRKGFATNVLSVNDPKQELALKTP
jgi:hypothetical protein